MDQRPFFLPPLNQKYGRCEVDGFGCFGEKASQILRRMLQATS
ncbi:hypothetical protein ACFSCZ_11520 [Siminovitchia sediminis]|uniref:Negative modulator of initiation of replication SeqA N-terminal domain-containing protein n=1 Tax=Siminovitchia sediminis TaxID=1274353 RepID=A0ABW4KH29_9BACI